MVACFARYRLFPALGTAKGPQERRCGPFCGLFDAYADAQALPAAHGSRQTSEQCLPFWSPGSEFALRFGDPVVFSFQPWTRAFMFAGTAPSDLLPLLRSVPNAFSPRSASARIGS